MSQNITESVTLTEATKSKTSGLLEVDFITPGWGSSGYYSREVVEAAAPLFAAGTQMYFDHPTATEEQDRPVRSVRDIAAVIESAGVVDKATGAVRGMVRPLKAYADLLTDEAFAKNVGLSIRGSATDIKIGEAEGRQGPIIEGLANLSSVDFVTKAGRGGKVLRVLESARLEEQILNVEEATASDRMSHLRAAIRTAHGAAGNSVYVRDQDAEKATVWFDVHDHRSGESTPKSFEQTYKVGANDVDVELTGTPTEVRAVTNYVPVSQPATEAKGRDLPADEAKERIHATEHINRLLKKQLAQNVPVTRPDSKTPTTEADQEVTMGNISIEESEHTRLLTEAGRVDALLTENTTLKAQNGELKESAAKRDRRDAAAKIVTDVAEAEGGSFDALQTAGLLADLPVKENGDFDVEKFTSTVKESVATVKARGGAGSVTGFGGTATDHGEDTVSEADIDKSVAGAFGRTLKEA